MSSRERSAGGLSRRDLLHGAAAAVTVAGVPGLLAGCVGDEGDTLSRAREVGTIRVGHANEPPFGYVDDRGRLTGYSAEVVRLVFRDLGVERVEGTATAFDGLLKGLGTGAYDVVAAGMFVTPERCAQAAFALPDYCAQQAFLVRRGPLERARGLEELAASADTRLGVLGGSIEVGRARRAGVPSERLLEYPDKAAMRSALVSGEVDALALTTISLRRMARNLPQQRFRLTMPFTLDDPDGTLITCGAAAFRTGDTRLRDAFSDALRKRAAARDLVPIGRRFGLRPEEIPPRASTGDNAPC